MLTARNFMTLKDLSGSSHNGMTFVRIDHRDSGKRAHWLMKCHCGKNFVAQGYHITSGHTKSCGCMFSVNQIGYKEKIKKKILNNIAVTGDGCWEWKKSYYNVGYPQIVAFGRGQHGQRISYRVFVGDFDESLLVCHKCDNRKCLNPDHLFVGTHKDNTADMINKKRQVVLSGEQSPRAKLSAEDVLLARKLYSDGTHGCSVLSKMFGVTSGTIWCAITGKTWKNIKAVKDGSG